MPRRLLFALTLVLATSNCSIASDDCWFTARVTVDEGRGDSHYGTGTPIYRDGSKTLILTNAHVVPDGKNPISVMLAGKTYAATYRVGSNVTEVAGARTVYGTRAIKIDGPDLAVIEIATEAPVVPIAHTAPVNGDEVWQCGFANWATPVVLRGVVKESAVYESELTSTLVSAQGDSGAGVFNTQGELVGVTHSGIPKAATTFAVQLVQVRAFLGHPRLAKLFPNLANHLATKRAIKAAAAAVAAQPPVVAAAAKPAPKISSNKPGAIPPCQCGCMETGKCACKNCCERTADPTWVKPPTNKPPTPKAPAPKDGKDAKPAAALPAGPSYDPYRLESPDAIAASLKAGHTLAITVGAPADPFVGTYQQHARVEAGAWGLKDGTYMITRVSHGKYTIEPYVAPARSSSAAPICVDGRCYAPGTSAPTYGIPFGTPTYAPGTYYLPSGMQGGCANGVCPAPTKRR